MSLNTAKMNMMRQQIHTLGNNDINITNILIDLPRENFVSEEMKAIAYADVEIPLGHGEHMFTPRLEAQILNAIQTKKSDKVLEIGTGSGHFTAILARLTDSVVTVDIHEDFSTEAKYRLKKHGIYNVRFCTGNASAGWEIDKQYDLIVVNGALPTLPDTLKKQLTIGGRVFYIFGKKENMEGVVVTRTSETQWLSKSYFDTRVDPIKEATQPEKFTF